METHQFTQAKNLAQSQKMKGDLQINAICTITSGVLPLKQKRFQSAVRENYKDRKGL